MSLPESISQVSPKTFVLLVKAFSYVLSSRETEYSHSPLRRQSTFLCLIYSISFRFSSDHLAQCFQVFCSLPPTSLFSVAIPGILPDSLHFLTQVGGKNWNILRAWSVPNVWSIHSSAACWLLYQQDSSLSCSSQLGLTYAALSRSYCKNYITSLKF